MSWRVVVAERGIAGFVARALEDGATENGEALFGTIIDKTIIVVGAIPAGPGALRTRTQFRPDARWQQNLLNLVHSRFGFDYVGDIHTHPGNCQLPSRTDLETARHIVIDPTVNKPIAVFPIAVVRDRRVAIRAFLMQREGQAFEEIEIVTVADTSPVMAAVLTGTEVPPKGALGEGRGKNPAGYGRGIGFWDRAKSVASRLRRLPQG